MNPFGEIIHSTLSTVKVHSWQWDCMPAFGSLIITKHGEYELYGIVSHLETGSNDPGRYPYAYQKTEEELKREQPQIFALLQTISTCIILGYKHKGIIYYQLPPYIAKIHSFVRTATHEEVTQFIAQPQYLHPLFSHANSFTTPDELMLAFINNLLSSTLMTKQQLYDFIETFSALARSDYRKLKLFLSRVQSLVNQHNLDDSSIIIASSSDQSTLITR